MSDKSIKYCLFCHFAKYEKEDFETYTSPEYELDKRTSFAGVDYLEQHMRGLRQLLDSPGYEGMLVLFYSRGLVTFLNDDEHDRTEKEARERLCEKYIDLRFAHEFAERVRSLLRREELQERVRCLTPLDLIPVVRAVTPPFKADFKSYFIGRTEGVNYDSPKLIESIVRLRLLGNGIPVLRVDHDVLFRGGKSTAIGDLGMFKAIAISIRAYQLRLENPAVSTFIFSSSYNTRALKEKPADMDWFEAWSRAFATRVFPGLLVDAQRLSECVAAERREQAGKSQAIERSKAAALAAIEAGTAADKADEDAHERNRAASGNPTGKKDADSAAQLARRKRELCVEAVGIAQEEQRAKQAAVAAADLQIESIWEGYLADHLNQEVLARFYGLDRDTLEARYPAGPTRTGVGMLGAHPIYAVISGALLCLSEGAILDLPPFSNLRHNVMWIDDHLKYSLHRALNHFTSGQSLVLEPGLSDARLDDVSVNKARPPVQNLPAYVFGQYLPSLLWGAVFDAWITTDPIVKWRYSSFSADSADGEAWKKARDLDDRSILGRALLAALRAGVLTQGDEVRLEKTLGEAARQRIKEVRVEWSQLRTPGHETFASLWAKGGVAAAFEPSLFPRHEDGKPQNDLWKGLDGNVAVELILKDMIDDAIGYVRWTLKWPQFTQIVRSVPRGHFAGDPIGDHREPAGAEANLAPLKRGASA